MRSERRSARTLTALVALALPVAAATNPGPEPAAATVCAACHGEGGRSSTPAFPNLAGQQAEYLRKQLIDFAKGRRTNEAMSTALAQVPRRDFPTLVMYYTAQPAPPGRGGGAVLAAAGRRIFEEGDWAAGIPPCRSCHGERGAGDERYPRLAGQNPQYTLQQLADFKAGTRRNDPGRVMREVAGRLGEMQMKALAEYLGGL